MPEEVPRFPGGFDYGWYLRTIGVRQVIKARTIEKTGVAGGWRRAVRGVFVCRDVLATRLIEHVTPAENAAVLLAMTRRRFLRSGAIHVFAVSGLHVGIVAMLIGMVLKLSGLPYRWRCALTPGLLGVYVVMTGASPSSLRAWTMLSLAGMALWRDRKLCPINIVATAAILLLCINPLSLFQSGFLFSFTIVSILVLGWPRLARVATMLCERDLWLPRRLRSRRRRAMIRGGVEIAGASLLAWLGSAGLVAHANGLIVPGALLVNLVLSMLAYGTIALAAPKALLSTLRVPWIGEWLGWLLGMMLSLLRNVVDLGSRAPASLSVAQPSLWPVLLYYGLLAVAITPHRGSRLRLACLWLAGMWIAWMCIVPRRQPVLATFHGHDCDVPVVVMERVQPLPPVAIFSGTYLLHRDLLGWLQQRGHRELDALIIPWTLGQADRAAPLTVDLVDVNALVAPPRHNPRGPVAAAATQQHRSGARVRFAAAGEHGDETLDAHTAGITLTIRRKPFGRELLLRDLAAPIPLNLRLETSENGPCTIDVWQDDGPLSRLDIVPTLQRKLVALPLPGHAMGASSRPATGQVGQP